MRDLLQLCKITDLTSLILRPRTIFQLSLYLGFPESFFVTHMIDKQDEAFVGSNPTLAPWHTLTKLANLPFQKKEYIDKTGIGLFKQFNEKTLLVPELAMVGFIY